MVAVQLAFSGENKQKSYEASRQQASNVADVFSANPVQIRATFHLHVLAGLLDGSYEYDQLSKDEYREEIKAPGISELFIFKDGRRYSVRSRELEPLPVHYLRELVYSARMIPSNVPISKVTTAVQNGDNATCYVMEGSKITGDYSA